MDDNCVVYLIRAINNLAIDDPAPTPVMLGGSKVVSVMAGGGDQYIRTSDLSATRALTMKRFIDVLNDGRIQAKEPIRVLGPDGEDRGNVVAVSYQRYLTGPRQPSLQLVTE